ncbi:hypothetical protein ACE1TH_16055 [Shouchella sp. JSM 1781072]|uniref:hypothetical protein n=1 Tax=Bacillaceae TaxID=186817 RepID=UPI0020D0833B|nr:hypothetical protein [Alkalihalobacillus sp. LMS6]UTR06120.1 hypothetical protein MM326_18905 [Alkalihalobacillus sp. LMS6]
MSSNKKDQEDSRQLDSEKLKTLIYEKVSILNKDEAILSENSLTNLDFLIDVLVDSKLISAKEALLLQRSLNFKRNEAGR